MAIKKSFYPLLGLFLPLCACKDKVVNTYEGCCGNLPLSAKIGNVSIYVPNVFTPNFDLHNDLLFIGSSGDFGFISDFILKDKSGSVVWQSGTKRAKDGDDGFVLSFQEVDKIPEGKLSYTFKVTPPLGAAVQFQGFICKNTDKDANCPTKDANCIFSSQTYDGVLDKQRPANETCK